MNFFDWLIDFLSKKLNSNSLFKDETFIVQEAFEATTELDFPQIAIQQLDDTEKSITFDGEVASQIGIQITGYVTQMSIDNEIKTAQQVARIVGDEIKKILGELYTSRVNKNILQIRRVGSTPTIKIDSTYYSTVSRWQIVINQPYDTQK